MPGRSSVTNNMAENDSYFSKDIALGRSVSPIPNIGNLNKAYKTLPENSTTQPRTSIIKAKFTGEQKNNPPIIKESSPNNAKAMDREKSSKKSRFSICKSPIVTDETTGALIEFSTGTDIGTAKLISCSNQDPSSIPLNTYNTVSGSVYRSRYSPQRTFEPLQSVRSVERRLRRVTETDEDLPSPIKSPTTQKPLMEQVEEEDRIVSPKVSRFLITKTSLQPESDASSNTDPSLETTINHLKSLDFCSTTDIPVCPVIEFISPSNKSMEHLSSKELLTVPRKSLLKHSNSGDTPGGGSSGSSSCSSVGSSKSLKATKLSLLKASNELAQEEASGSNKQGKYFKSSNVSFGKEVIYLDGEPVGTPPPSRERSKSDASSTLTKLRNITMRRNPKNGSKIAWIKEKQSALKQAKDVDPNMSATSEVKPTHKRANSCDVSNSTNINNDSQNIDALLDKPPDKIRPRTRSDKLSKSEKTKGLLEEVSTKASFDWPLGRLGKLRQKYTRKKSQTFKASSRRKSKDDGENPERNSKLNKKSKSIEAISKAHHPLAVSNKKSNERKEEADDLVYELPTHYQTVLPVIKSRVIRPVMGLFRQNSSKSKLKKNKRDRQRHPTDSEAGSRISFCLVL